MATQHVKSSFDPPVNVEHEAAQASTTVFHLFGITQHGVEPNGELNPEYQLQ